MSVRASQGAEWSQDGGNAQRTGFTPEEPALPWLLAWTLNGPDGKGGTTAHHYHQLRPHEPWEARICTGGAHVYAPAGKPGLYALRKTDGSVAWQFQDGTCNATPAYDAATDSLVVGTDEGNLFRLEAATGKVLGRFAAAAPLTKSILVAGDYAFALTSTGVLHKVALHSMALVWSYDAKAEAQTLPAFSEGRSLVVYCTADLFVLRHSGTGK